MNSMRSTERSLTILKNTCKMRARKVIQTRAFDLYIGSRTNKPFTQRRTVFFNRPIKLQECTQKRPLTVKSEEANFLNPNKPGPMSLKEMVVAPIVPISQPRFSKSTPETPSVTKVLSATMPASSLFILEKWRESMIKKLGAAGFSKYQADTFERGRALHAVIAKYLMGQGSPTEELSKEVVANLWKSIQNVVQEKISNVRLVEHIVTHPQMNYRGIVDCVAFYENELVVIDFKTAEKPKKNVESLYDNPLQVTAYCGAINNDSSIPAHVIDRNITAGLVIVAYMDGSKADVYYLNSDQVTNNYWKKWTSRLDQYARMEEMKQQQASNKSAAVKPK